MKNNILTYLILGAWLSVNCKNPIHESKNMNARKADSVLALMTLDEKIGQMTQLSGHDEATGIIDTNSNYYQEVIHGHVGSVLNINGASKTREVQQLAIENSRLGIPLLFAYDVIHGYKTITPIPLGEAASWDLEAIENSARTAAIEASAGGQHWTFAPMVDVTRDARWGRIMEGAGEDSYLGSLVAAARIKGFQGDNLCALNTIAACAKHYAGYGYSEGGRDYNYTEISDRTLREYILPPFKACIDAGVATFMTGFNDLNGVPASGNKKLGDILRKEWKFEGMVVSDWNSIGELKIHGIAQNNTEAAQLAFQAGIDMDMEGHVYKSALKEMLDKGSITLSQIDEAVFRILKLKFELGLFDDPFRYSDLQREQEVTLSAASREAARDIARKSMVLLRNKDNLLPLAEKTQSIALIGPLADDNNEILGNWRGKGKKEDAISVLDGFKKRFPTLKIHFATGCDFEDESKSGFSEALQAARQSDIIFVALGEKALMSGEAHSRTYLGLPGVQLDLLQELKETGKPIVLLLMNGRPLAIPEAIELSDAILETWFLGTEAGNAIADVVSGDYNPSGKLTVTFPNTSGQTPVYYNHRSTGRPGTPGDYTSRYDDAPIEPLLPFGFGLSYTNFNYSEIELSKSIIDFNDSLSASIRVQNTGNYDGYEVVQLYIQDIHGSVSRPVKELKGFEKVFLAKGESKIISFQISAADLAFWNRNMKYTAEPGLFNVMIGTNSEDYQTLQFELKK